MTQLVTHIDIDPTESIELLVADGVAASRSDAVGKGLQALTDQAPTGVPVGGPQR